MTYKIDTTTQAHIEQDLRSRSSKALPDLANTEEMVFVYDLSGNEMFEVPIELSDTYVCGGAGQFGRGVIDWNDTKNEKGVNNAKLFSLYCGLVYTVPGAAADAGNDLEIVLQLNGTNHVLASKSFVVSATQRYYSLNVYDYILLKNQYISVFVSHPVGAFPAGTQYFSGVSGILRPSGQM